MRTKLNNSTNHNSTNEIVDGITVADQSLVGGGEASSRETMSVLATVIGTLFGVVRVPFFRAIGPDSAPARFLRKIAATRAKDITVSHHEEVMPKRVTIARENEDSAEHTRAAELCSRRADLVELNDVSTVEEDLDDEKRKRLVLEEKYESLPAHAKGLIATWLAFALAVVIALADSAFVYAVLDHQGIPQIVHYATTILVPGVIFGINIAFGMGGWWIGNNIAPTARLKFAIGLLIAAVLAAAAAYGLLAFSRNAAIQQFNDDLAGWANGDGSAFRLAVSQWWFLGLQIAGSMAAAVFAACHVASNEGREMRKRLIAIDVVISRLTLLLEKLRRSVKELREQADEHTLLAIRVRGDARAAEVEIAELEQALPAKVDAEVDHGEAMVSKFESVYQYTDQLYANGGVVRMALPTVRRFGRNVTPPPTDAEGSPAAESPVWDPDTDDHNPLRPDPDNNDSADADDSADNPEA